MKNVKIKQIYGNGLIGSSIILLENGKIYAIERNHVKASGNASKIILAPIKIELLE